MERDPHPGPAHGDEPDADELAWRAIVDNYGERALLDEPESPDAPAPTGTSDPGDPVDPVDPVDPGDPVGPTGPASAPFGGRFGDLSAYDVYGGDRGDSGPVPDEDDERFVPPEPPPLPRVAPDRMLAWVGVLGSPVVLLACLLLSVGIPALLGYALVAAFVGGFGYLVWTMPREPRDPWDDGAQV